MNTDTCWLCARPLPVDNRNRFLRWIWPKYQFVCPDPDEADCFRAFAARLGIHPTDEEVREAMIRRKK